MTLILAKALDASAVGLSALCLIHCLALPALALLLPFLAFWAQAEWIHLTFVLARGAGHRTVVHRSVDLAATLLAVRDDGDSGPEPWEPA